MSLHRTGRLKAKPEKQQERGQLKLIYVDNFPQRATAKMLLAGADAYNKVILDSKYGDEAKLLDIEMKTIEESQKRNTIYDPSSTLILITVSERELSSRSNIRKTCRVPCPSIKAAQELLRKNGELRLFLVPVGTPPSFVGVDSMAALLWGASGVIEERGLVMEDVLREIVNHCSNNSRQRFMLLIGQPSENVQTMKEMIIEWQKDVEGSDDFECACWRACLALAQLEKLEPIMGAGAPYSFNKLAPALNLWEGKTGFRRSPGDLRRILRILAGRLLDADHTPKERTKLPEYARKSGFPPNPPAILGISDQEISKRLYDVLIQMEINNRDKLSDMAHVQIELPQRVYQLLFDASR